MTPKQINSHGLANGWHAQELANLAADLGMTMANVFKITRGDACAFNVPAKCTQIKAGNAYYEFLDGSKADFPLPKRG